MCRFRWVGVESAWHDFNDSRVSKLGRTMPEDARRCAAMALGDKAATSADPSAVSGSAKSVVEQELQAMTVDDRATTAALRSLVATMRGSESAYKHIYSSKCHFLKIIFFIFHF